MKQYPLVSILIPVYLRGDLSIETIDCALLQDYPNFEIIVNDNCSNDGSYELLCERYANNSKVHLEQNETNVGAVGNWKRCMERARGEYVKFLWSDDLMRSDFTRRAVELLEENEDASFVYSAVRMFRTVNEKDVVIEMNSSKQEEIIKNSEEPEKNLYDIGETGVYPASVFFDLTFKTPFKAPLSPGCALFRKNKVNIMDQIPNRLGYEHKKNGAGPDVLMFLEALKENEKFIFISEIMNYFREHTGSISCSDSTIMVGYHTAKLYFIKRCGLTQYEAWFNANIFLNKMNVRFLNYRENDRVLKQYYMNIDETVHGIELYSYMFCIIIDMVKYYKGGIIKKILGRK